MAIDFSQVKTITIPEGSVKKITDSNGVVLWKAQTGPQWHTVWSGSISKTVSTDTGSDVDIWTNNVSGTATFRFTFTMSASGGESGSRTVYYNGSSTFTTTEPSSPTQQNITYDTNKWYIVGVRRDHYSSSRWKISEVVLHYNGVTHKFYLRGGSGYGYNGTATLTITKIEQYY